MAINKSIITADRPMLKIIEFTGLDFDHLVAHFARHRSENGRAGTGWFMPYEQPDAKWAYTVAQRVQNSVNLPVSQPGWMRLWILGDDERIVGHGDLSGCSYVEKRDHSWINMPGAQNPH